MWRPEEKMTFIHIHFGNVAKLRSCENKGLLESESLQVPVGKYFNNIAYHTRREQLNILWIKTYIAYHEMNNIAKTMKTGALVLAYWFSL